MLISGFCGAKRPIVGKLGVNRYPISLGWTEKNKDNLSCLRTQYSTSLWGLNQRPLGYSLTPITIESCAPISVRAHVQLL